LREVLQAIAFPAYRDHLSHFRNAVAVIHVIGKHSGVSRLHGEVQRGVNLCFSLEFLASSNTEIFTLRSDILEIMAVQFLEIRSIE
jgi:hypothetical protein